CGGTCDGSIEIEVIGVVPDATVWSGPDGFTSNDEDIFDLCAGSYILSVTSADCEEQFVYVVNEPDPITIDFIDVVPPICFGQNNGSLEIDVDGGTGNLTSTWLEQPDCFFNETLGNSINNLFECTYVVVVEDESGCTATDSIFLDAPQVMDIFVSISDFGGPYNVSCNGASDGSISVSVNGGTQDCIGFDPECYFYDWTNCDAVNIPGISQQSNLPAGSYCVVVTDANGCVATTEIDLVQPDPIESAGAISDYNGFGVSCNGECDGWISPEVVGGNDNFVIYDWITGDIGENDAQADTLFNLCPGMYELRVVDINDCEEIISFELTEPDPIEITIDNVNDLVCFGDENGSISVSATGGVPAYDFEWNDGELFGNVITNLGGGTYYLDVTDLNGCLAEDSVLVMEPDTFEVVLTIPMIEGALFTLPCRGDSSAAIFTTINGGTPNFDVLWTGYTFNDPTALDQTGLPAGTYNIEVTDDLGCVAEAEAVITEPEENLTVLGTFENVLCAGECNGSIDIEVSGGVEPYVFLWELNNDGDTLSTQEDLMDLCPGLYEVLVSDANGCDTLLQYTIEEPDPIEVTATLSDYDGFNVSCPENCDGSIEIVVTGGTGTVTIEWMVNGTSVGGGNNLLGLCAGDVVNLILTDENDCTEEIIYVITSPEEISPNATVQNITCDGIDAGSITLNPTGGVPPYSYSWVPDFGDTNEITDLDPGEYCVTITDANGCSIEECWEITQPEEITVD
ncbi:MAG: SprB repeat-containing protein, partial [Bacteroidota bacterium]